MSALIPVLKSAAFAPLPDVGWIRVTGSDRTRWLNGMVTNNIKDLAAGQGSYSFVLSNQGRIQADLTAFSPVQPEQEEILIETARARIPALIELLDRFIIMDDVELADVSLESQGLMIAGPNALATLKDRGLLQEAPAPLSMSNGHFQGKSVTVIQAHSPLVPRFELWSGPETISALTRSLTAEIPQADPETLEQLRILEGTPLYGTDIRDKELPQETAQSHALHFSKGCYLGQEIVERIHSRGAVHRTFGGFLLTGSLPPPGASLSVDEKPVGELTSVAAISLPAGIIQMALGYIRGEVLRRAALITYPGGTAVPISLPAEHAQS